MKKIALFLFSLFMVVSGYTQSQRMVLAEECTSSTCGPCGQQNPAFDALLQANSDIITAIKYHVWWPAPGNDPMYLANKADNTARTSYYNVNSVPHVMLDGTYFNGMPSQVNQTTINNAAAVSSPFEIQVQQQLSPDEDTIYLTTLIHATDQVSGNLVGHVVVIEKHIHFNTPPGSNGEKDFYNVMKKLLPTQGGAEMPSSMDSGDYVILQNAWALENVYDNNELGAVSFVQNSSTKEVFQAANSSTDPITPVYSLDAQILSVMDVTSYNCSGSVTPAVIIRNNGSTDLTSFTIHYSVNDGEPQSYEWSGDLAFLATAQIQLSTVNFAVQDTNHLVISCDNPNGANDDYPSNNTSNSPMYEASLVSGNIVLALILDDHPEETTWEIYNSLGDTVQHGGPYDTPGQMIIPIELDYGNCFQFVIHDAGGNGTDYYALVYGGNNIIFEGSDFGSIARNEFQYSIVGIEVPELISDVNVYPNPATDNLNIDFYLSDYSPVDISITDRIGKLIYSEKLNEVSPGRKHFEIHTNNLLPGMYLLKVDAVTGSFVRKVSIR